jgi:hypothetical protein
MSNATETETDADAGRASRRDVRVDHLGFVNELTKHFADPLKQQIKLRMNERKLDLAEGDFFEGLLVRGESSSIDPAKYLKLFEKGRITRADFLSALSIKRTAATVFLSEKEVDAISDATPATPQLRVSRRKGVEIKLVDAVRGLADAIGPPV